MRERFLVAGAVFDANRTYRYQLERVWDAGRPTITFVMLNPSTADETKLDPTLRRCFGFARDLGFGRMLIANLFGWRSTSPDALYGLEDPVGPDNDHWIVDCVRRAEMVIAAWGDHGTLLRRGEAVEHLITGRAAIHRLSVTKGGAPGHPLYLPASTRPVLHRAQRDAA